MFKKVIAGKAVARRRLQWIVNLMIKKWWMKMLNKKSNMKLIWITCLRSLNIRTKKEMYLSSSKGKRYSWGSKN